MLEVFINKLHTIDPDLLVAHGLCSNIIEVLLARIQFLRIAHWSRLGRMKRNQMPGRKMDGGFQGHSWVPRQVSCGRLLVDTFLNSKELIRETNYDLGNLAKTQLKKDRREFDDEMLPRIFQTSKTIFQLVDHTETDAFLTHSLMMHLQIIPLTKQLTTIAGNLWFRSLQNARAERNEWLLMHEFYQRKFLCPDKKTLSARDAKKSLFGDEMANEAGGEAKGKAGKGPKRKKAKYGGGLVLEPKAGFYDSIILLLDFNSLYPSIIMEYNLCFTTVARRHTKNYDGSEMKALTVAQMDNPDDEEAANDGAEMAELPQKTGTAGKDAILPNVLRNLVQKRKLVKDQIKKEKDPVKLGQLDIRQKALKLTANSMYGCLGFSSSRFHAQAIAALITRTGRETLLKTKDIAEEKLGFNVVYGDTDSIMINTGTQVLSDSLKMGQQLKAEVNVLYKCLEIEIDGVFKSLLLLKKKKYAALNIENFGTANERVVKEVKGLDMVRRDWCNLSKDVGNKVLEEILSGKEREQIVMVLNNYLSDIGKSMKENTTNLALYVITKQLTRAPSEYSDFKSLPHVIVADRLIKQGKSESELVNNFIGYVICKKAESDNDEAKKE
jgi:DNA polymerase alpha subunit A